jgi:ferredoxin
MLAAHSPLATIRHHGAVASPKAAAAAAAPHARPPSAAAAQRRRRQTAIVTFSSGDEATTTTTSSSSPTSPSAPKAKPQIEVHFRREGATAIASPGDVIMEVAAAAGVEIPGGCYSGSCGICEVDVFKISGDGSGSGGSGSGSSGAGAVVRACVARLPPGYARVEVDALPDDTIWGLDGFDT